MGYQFILKNYFKLNTGNIDNKSVNIILCIISVLLMIFSGVLVLSGIISIADGNIDSLDIFMLTVLSGIFFFAFRLFLKNKKPKSNTVVKSKSKYALGIVLMVFNGIAVISGSLVVFTSEYDGSDIALILFFALLFLLGYYLYSKNKDDSNNSYYNYIPHSGNKISWTFVAIIMIFSFPIGYYLLYKKMSQYSNEIELRRNIKTLKKWAIGFAIFLSTPLFSGYLTGFEIIMYCIFFGFLPMFLFKASKNLEKVYKEVLSNVPKYKVEDFQKPEENMEKLKENIEKLKIYNTKNNTNKTFEPTYAVVNCKGCNAPNKVLKGTVSECEYCGTPINS